MEPRLILSNSAKKFWQTELLIAIFVGLCFFCPAYFVTTGTIQIAALLAFFSFMFSIMMSTRNLGYFTKLTYFNDRLEFINWRKKSEIILVKEIAQIRYYTYRKGRIPLLTIFLSAHGQPLKRKIGLDFSVDRLQPIFTDLVSKGVSVFIH